MACCIPESQILCVTAMAEGCLFSSLTPAWDASCITYGNDCQKPYQGTDSSWRCLRGAEIFDGSVYRFTEQAGDDVLYAYKRANIYGRWEEERKKEGCFFSLVRGSIVYFELLTEVDSAKCVWHEFV